MIYAMINPTGSGAQKMALDEVARQAMKKVATAEEPTYWVRTCEECFTRQSCEEPSSPVSDAYRNAKCRHCKSESLDYGSGGWLMTVGTFYRKAE